MAHRQSSDNRHSPLSDRLQAARSLSSSICLRAVSLSVGCVNLVATATYLRLRLRYQLVASSDPSSLRFGSKTRLLVSWSLGLLVSWSLRSRHLSLVTAAAGRSPQVSGLVAKATYLVCCGRLRFSPQVSGFSPHPSRLSAAPPPSASAAHTT